MNDLIRCIDADIENIDAMLSSGHGAKVWQPGQMMILHDCSGLVQVYIVDKIHRL